MKWFKHFSDAADDEVLSALKDRFGMEGYGVWWVIVETISRQIHDGPKDFAEYSVKKWREITGIFTPKLNKILEFLCENSEESPKLLYEFSEKKGIKYLKVRIPKILEMADEYTQKRLTGKKKSGQTPDKLQTKSGETPKKIPLDKIRLDKKRNTSSPKLKFTDDDIKLVEELDTYVLDVNPKHKFSGGQRKQKWANTFRLMRKEDNRTVGDVQAVMKAAFEDSFWSTVIQSAGNLREHYNQLRAKMLGGKGNEKKPIPTAPYH